MANLKQLGPRDNFTVDECLQYCVTEQKTPEQYQDVMVLAYDLDNRLIVRSSRMSRKDALWMLTAAIDHVLGR